MTDVKDTEIGTQTEKPDKHQSTPTPVASPLSDQQRAEMKIAQQDAIQKKQDLVSMQSTGVINPIELAQMEQVADKFHQAGAVSDKFKNTEQILMALMAGREMGMSFNESMTGLYFVNGQLNIYGKQTPAALRRSGWKHVFIDETETSTTAMVWKGGTKYDKEKQQMMPDPENIEEFYKDTFDVGLALRSGFVNGKSGRKVGWKEGKNMQRKMRYEVLSLIIHTYIPEVLGSVAGIGEVSQRYQNEATEMAEEHKTGMRAKIDQALQGEVLDAATVDSEFKPKPISNGT